MDTAFPPAPIHSDWKILYRAAILEPDKKVLRQKVREAEAAVVARGRELFYAGGTRDEKEALEDALYLLRAYRNAWDHAESEATQQTAKAAA